MRTQQELSKQYRKCENCCSEFIVLHDTNDPLQHRLILAPLRCKSYFCDTCCQIKRKQFITRFLDSIVEKQINTITLTIRSTYNNPIKATKTINYLFNKFTQQLRRLGYSFSYLKILEFTKNEFPHLHIVTFQEIPKQIITKLWRKYAKSWQVDCQYRQNHSKVVQYVSKYFSKGYNKELAELYFLHQKRHFSYSKDFFIALVAKLKLKYTFLKSSNIKDLWNAICDYLESYYDTTMWHDKIIFQDNSGRFIPFSK